MKYAITGIITTLVIYYLAKTDSEAMSACMTKYSHSTCFYMLNH